MEMLAVVTYLHTNTGHTHTCVLTCLTRLARTRLATFCLDPAFLRKTYLHALVIHGGLHRQWLAARDNGLISPW
jgi:hypothetical protein